MKKDIAYVALFILFALAGSIAYFSFHNKAGVVPATDTTSEPAPPSQVAYKGLIVISKPAHNELISSPLIVSGKARGTWYFEASFPIVLLDANGKVIAQSHAEAQGDPEDGSADGAGWMTEAFVPFSGTIEFTTPATKTGTILFRKDNPSGLPENDDAIGIPVRFAE